MRAVIMSKTKDAIYSEFLNTARVVNDAKQQDIFSTRGQL